MKSMISKRLATAALIAAFTLGGFAPAGAQAQSASELNAQITALLATIASLQAQLSSLQGGAPAGATQFASDLTVGSTGPQVAALQTFLESKGFLTMPAGVAKGMFGALTRSALLAYQAARGISPASGYFGPITRARVNAEIAASAPATGTQPGTSPAGNEGDIKIDMLGTPSAEDVEKGIKDAKVLGFEVEADGSDMTIQRVDVNFKASDATKNTRPWTYFTDVALFAGGKKIAEIDADSRADWSERNGTYQIRFTNVSETIKRDTARAMYIAVTAHKSIDSRNLGQEWTVAIPDNGVRARDTLNLDQYSGNATETFTIEDRTTGSIKLRRAQNSPEAKVIEGSSSSDTKNVTLLAFSLEGRNSDITVEKIGFNLSSNDLGTGSIGDLVGSVRLYKGSTEIASRSVSTTSVVFDRVKLEIGEDEVETYTLKADIRKIDGVRNQEGITVAASVSSVEGEDEERDDVAFTGSASGETVAFYTKGIRAELDSVSEQHSSQNSLSRGSYTIKFKVTAFGDDIHVDRQTTEDNDGSFAPGTGVNFSITNPDDNETTSILTSTAERTNGSFLVRKGRTETFTLSVAATATGSNFALIALEAINWGLEENAINSFYTFNLGEFRTDPLYLSI